MHFSPLKKKIRTTVFPFFRLFTISILFCSLLFLLPAAAPAQSLSGGEEPTMTEQVQSNNNPSQTTENVTFTVEVSAATGTPTGTVEFFEDGNSLGTASLSPGPAPLSDDTGAAAPRAVAHAQLTHQFLFGGSRNITAAYSGGPGFLPSNSNANPLVQQVIGPTPAAVSVTGRVSSGANGRGLFKARITLTDSRGQIRFALSNPFGYYRFTDLEAGETYTLRVSAKNRVFSPATKIITADDNLTGIDFVSEN